MTSSDGCARRSQLCLFRLNQTETCVLVQPPDDPERPGAPYDTIFAENGVANDGRQIHNEYAVFRPEHAYPELILYYRV